MLVLCRQFLGSPDTLSFSLCPLRRAGAAQLPLAVPVCFLGKNTVLLGIPGLAGQVYNPEGGDIREGHFRVSPSKGHALCAQAVPWLHCRHCKHQLWSSSSTGATTASLCSHLCHLSLSHHVSVAQKVSRAMPVGL